MKATSPAFLVLPALMLAALFCSCAVGPNYRRPPLVLPAQFSGPDAAATNSLADLAWWQLFHDDHLRALIGEAVTNNYDLRMAVARVEQARARVAEARSFFFPQIGYGGTVAGGRNLQGSGQLVPSGNEGTIYSADLNAAWEIDLWGRIRRQTEAARAEFFATQEARRSILTSLIAQVAQNYFLLLALDRRLQIARESTNSFGDSLKIFRQRLEGGVASKLETASAEALLENAKATMTDLEQQIVLQENQLDVLLGRNPGPIARGQLSLQAEEAPAIPAGLPSALIERRPDIREAEQALRAANARVGVAEANFFPQLNLTGLFGRVSPELSGLTSGQALAWSAAAGLTGPLFQGGRLRAQYAEARAAREEAALQFQSRVLNALQEVSNELVAREKLTELIELRQRAVTAFQSAFQIAMARYRMGTSSYYEVLQQQQQLFPAEDFLAQTQMNHLLAVVQLYRALGGGWAIPGEKK